MVTKLATAAHAYALSCQKQAHIARRRYVTCWGVIAGHLSFDLSTASGKLMLQAAAAGSVPKMCTSAMTEHR